MVRLFVSWRLCPHRSDTLNALRWLADIISIDNMIDIIRTWLIDTCHFLHQAVNVIQNFLTLPGPQTQKTKSKGNWRLTTRPHWRRQGYVAVCDPPLIQKVNALSLTVETTTLSMSLSMTWTININITSMFQFNRRLNSEVTIGGDSQLGNRVCVLCQVVNATFLPVPVLHQRTFPLPSYKSRAPSPRSSGAGQSISDCQK